MIRRDSKQERGGTRLNLILTLVILAVLIFSGVKIIPWFFANYEFQDAIGTEARYALANRKTEEDIRDDVWKKMQELGIPARREDLHVSNQSGIVQISLDYNVPVDLRVFQFKLAFHTHADNRSI